MVTDNALAETIYDQLNRGTIRDLILDLKGKRPRLAKPDAAEALAEAIEDLSVSARLKLWPTLVREFDDWKAACDDLGVEGKKSALRDRLLKGVEPRRRPSKAGKRKAKRASSPVRVLGEDHIPTLIRLVEAAKKEIVLVAYVVGGGFSALERPLLEAVARKVKVHLVLDGRKTKHGNGELNKKQVRGLPKKVKVSYGKIHAKFAVIDGRYVVLGSSNLDHPRSIIFQANVELDSAELGKSLLASLASIPPCD